MIEAQPILDINAVHTANVQYDIPTQLPPMESTHANGATRTAGVFATALQDMRGQAAPTLPTTAGAAGAATTITAWQNSKKVDALWTINQDRNSWFGVEGIGWRHLANVDETSVTALTMLVGHARSTGAVVNYREESDNLVHEVYVW